MNRSTPDPTPGPAGGRGLEATVLATPVGPLAVVVDGDGVVVASGFGTLADAVGRLDHEPGRVRARPDLGDVSRAVADYVAGDLAALDRVPVAQPGTDLLQRMWLELRGVAPGSTVSYGELAALAGRPGAVRPAGNACARNLVAPFVPCHRVVRADGSLGSYYYGTDVKQALLVHEGALDALYSSRA